VHNVTGEVIWARPLHDYEFDDGHTDAPLPDVGKLERSRKETFEGNSEIEPIVLPERLPAKHRQVLVVAAPSPSVPATPPGVRRAEGTPRPGPPAQETDTFHEGTASSNGPESTAVTEATSPSMTSASDHLVAHTAQPTAAPVVESPVTDSQIACEAESGEEGPRMSEEQPAVVLDVAATPVSVSAPPPRHAVSVYSDENEDLEERKHPSGDGGPSRAPAVLSSKHSEMEELASVYRLPIDTSDPLLIDLESFSDAVKEQQVFHADQVCEWKSRCCC
jgi:hypothetical protein